MNILIFQMVEKKAYIKQSANTACGGSLCIWFALYLSPDYYLTCFNIVSISMFRKTVLVLCSLRAFMNLCCYGILKQRSTVYELVAALCDVILIVFVELLCFRFSVVIKEISNKRL